MSLTASVWLLIVIALVPLALYRSTFAFSLYLLTFFLGPAFWWWGNDTMLAGIRWNLYAGIIFLVSTAIHSRGSTGPRLPGAKLVSICAVLMLINATLVHFTLAPNLEVSAESYFLLAKFVLLYFMIVACLKSPRELNLALLSLTLGAAYIGFEVTINHRGHFSGERLEGVGAAGVQNSNELASLLVTVLPVIGGFFFLGNTWIKVLVALAAPMILNVVLMCNSRGAFLAMFASAGAFLASAVGRVRRKALLALTLGGVALFFLLGDSEIVDRFLSIFVSEDQLDNSAASRLLYWKAAFLMLKDHPFGAGGDGFSIAYAAKYLARVGVDMEFRAVHNGFINEACEWGVQGFLLRMLFLAGGCWIARSTLQTLRRQQDDNHALFGSCLIASIAAFCGSAMFGDYMDGEWGYWVVALMVGYARLYGQPALVAERERVEHVPVTPTPVGPGHSRAPAPQPAMFFSPARPLASPGSEMLKGTDPRE